MMKYNKKIITAGIFSTTLLLTAPCYSLADNPISNLALAKAIGHEVAKVLIYPMQQFASVIKYTFDSRAKKAASLTQSRFPKLPYAQMVVAQNTQTIANALAQLTSQASINTQATLAQANDQICSHNDDKKLCYSSQSAQTLLEPNAYSPIQRQAARTFLNTVSGAYIALPPPNSQWNQKDENVIKYSAFYKTINALQSIGQRNLAHAYSIRATSHNQPSALNLYHTIMTGDATNPGFWNEINKVPVVGQLVTIANYMPAIAIGIARTNQYLEMINNALSALLVEQSILAQNSSGVMLYQQAKQSANPNNKNAHHLAFMH